MEFLVDDCSHIPSQLCRYIIYFAFFVFTVLLAQSFDVKILLCIIYYDEIECILESAHVILFYFIFKLEINITDASGIDFKEFNFKMIYVSDISCLAFFFYPY